MRITPKSNLQLQTFTFTIQNKYRAKIYALKYFMEEFVHIYNPQTKFEFHKSEILNAKFTHLNIKMIVYSLKKTAYNGFALNKYAMSRLALSHRLMSGFRHLYHSGAKSVFSVDFNDMRISNLRNLIKLNSLTI